MYQIRIGENIVYISVNGIPNKPESVKLFNEIEEEFKNIDTAKYNLIVDGRDVEVVTIDAMKNFENIVNLYFGTQFMRKFYISSKAKLTQMQLCKVLENLIVDPSFEVVESYEEAIEKI